MLRNQPTTDQLLHGTVITACYYIRHTLKHIKIPPDSEWSNDHSRYTDLPRISKTATRTKPTKRVSCAPFRQLRGPSFWWPKSPSFASFKANPSSISELTHVRQYSSHTAQILRQRVLKKRTQFISQIQASDGLLSSEDGSCKFHEYRNIPYPVQGVPAPQALAASMLQYSLIIAITRPITPTRHARLPEVTTSPRGAKCM